MKKENETKGGAEVERRNAGLLREVVGAFSQFPDKVTVEVVSSPTGEMLKLQVHQADHPRVVGAMGKHIQALRTIFQFIGARDGAKIQLMLLEPREGRPGPVQPFKANLSWDPAPVRELLARVLARIFTSPCEVDIFSAEETTNVEIRAEPGEFEISDALAPHLQPIFHAIGKQQGRQIYLTAASPIPIAKR